MNITVDLLDGNGAQDFSGYVLDDGGLEIKRALNRPSQCSLKLLLQRPQVLVPQIGAKLAIASVTAEALFTGVVADVSFEYLGWGEQGPVHAVALIALSVEATLGGASVPGGLTGTTTASAGGLLAAQIAGAAAVANDGGFAEGIQIPAIEIGAGESAMDVMEAVSSQSRLSYRVIGGQLVVQPVGAVVHTANSQIEELSTAAAKTTVTVKGKNEAQTFVSEYSALNGSSSLIQVSEPIQGAEERKLFYDAFANGQTLLAVSGAVSAVSIAKGAVSVAASGSVCELAVGAPVELGGRVLFEVGNVVVASCGEPGLMGLMSDPVLRFDQNGNPAGCFAGFELSAAAGGGAQFQAVMNGVLSGPAVGVNTASKYTLRVRLFAPEHVRRAQVYHSSKHPASSGLGGQDIASWVSVHCEMEEQSAGGKTLWLLATQTLAESPSFATAVAMNATVASLTMAAVKVTQGPAVEARYVAGGSERLLRFGAKRDGAEAWLSKGQVKLSWTPASGDVLKLRYRTGGVASATATLSGGNASVVVGEHSLTVNADSPVTRSTADCENAAAALLADASDPAALLQGQVMDPTAALGTDVWPGDAISVGGNTGIVRDVTITPVSMRADTFQTKIKLANDGASPIAIKSTPAKPLLTAARGVAGAIYAPDLTSVQVSGVAGGAVQVDCGTLVSGGAVEVRSTAEGWGQTTAGLVASSSTAQFSLPQGANADEFYLKQVDGSGNYSREMALVKTSL
ncbi:MAG: hypothetical protein ABI383_09105 [Acidobacteriaceae bacterium]